MAFHSEMFHSEILTIISSLLIYISILIATLTRPDIQYFLDERMQKVQAAQGPLQALPKTNIISFLAYQEHLVTHSV